MIDRIYSHFGNRSAVGRRSTLRILLLTPIFVVAALIAKGPGLRIRLLISMLGVRLLNSRLDRNMIRSIILSPMDSFRYFEFDFAWKTLSRIPTLGRYLDVSSPRLLGVTALCRLPFQDATFVNPDPADLELTRALVEECGLTSNCTLSGALIGDFNGTVSSFDTIVSISVIEHIPDEGDIAAIGKMWGLLRPGGILLVSVPCAATSLEEYVDFNEYGLQTPDQNDFVFGQRFYDETSLRERIFKIIGEPARFAVFGERREGAFVQNRLSKLTSANYPHWREPYMMARDYRYFERVSDLPAWGVIAMEFIKQ